eukprot:TRINITY_DN51747_c0_g1_i2.p1 TRINITY_DN51747_c0_g1~~TRINITY_DN51747_c0_g1_i2.p1  ORF type:complete len:163 (-),score=47.73 TRINITY_DN51747_c0_g1_i2:277-765(-)
MKSMQICIFLCGIQYDGCFCCFQDQVFVFFFSSRRRHTRCREVSWARRCVQETGINAEYMGGIGYTNIYPVEKIYRDIRLSTIWTGSNEVMSMIIAHEWYKEIMKQMKDKSVRDCEFDCAEADAKDEKIYEQNFVCFFLQILICIFNIVENEKNFYLILNFK